MKRFLALFIVLGALAMAAPGLIGYQVETYYQGLMGQFGKSGLDVVSQTYQRNWFGAEAHTRFQVNLPVGPERAETETFSFNLISQIDHGPLTSDGLALAKIKSEITSEGEAFLPADYEAEINTLIDIGGQGVTRVKLPATQSDAVGDRPAIRFEGMDGEMRFDAALETVSADFTLPVLVLSDDKQQSLEIHGMKLSSHSSQDISGLMLGGGAFTVERILVQDPESGSRVEMDQLGIDASSSAEADSVSAFVRYRLEKVQVDDQVFGPAVLKLGFGNLPAAVLLKIQESVEEINAQQLSDERKGMALLSVLMGNAPGLLKGDPIITIDELSVQTPDGLIAGTLSLQSQGLEWKEITHAPAVLNKLVGDASLQMPEKLFRMLMQQKVQGDLLRQFEQRRLMDPDSEMPTAEQLTDMSNTLVERQLELMLGQDLLVKEGGAIMTNAKLASGLLSVNGKTIPLPVQAQ
ncbi:MAG: YdgA family protein [Sedimenticola sp.]|nr:YdgA family protein [Sedimenticola sp.]